MNINIRQKTNVNKFRPDGGETSSIGVGNGTNHASSTLDDITTRAILRDLKGVHHSNNRISHQSHQSNTIGAMNIEQLANMLSEKHSVPTGIIRDNEVVKEQKETNKHSSKDNITSEPISSNHTKYSGEDYQTTEQCPLQKKVSIGSPISSNLISSSETVSQRPQIPSQHIGGTGDRELLDVMIQRLRTLEKNHRIMQLELKEKSRKIIELEDRLKDEQIKRKEEQNARGVLAKELADIHDFLQEYNLTWVGKGNASVQEDDEDVQNTEKPRNLQRTMTPLSGDKVSCGTSVVATEERFHDQKDSSQCTGTDVPPFNLFSGNFMALNETTIGKSNTGSPNTAVPYPPNTIPSALVLLRQEKHRQYQLLNPVGRGAAMSKETSLVNEGDQRKIKKLPFDLKLFIVNCGILSDHVGEKGFFPINAGQRNPGEGDMSAVGAQRPLISDANSKNKILREREKVFVAIYNDGIVINSGLFRPYGWALCDAFLNDVLDGYYPYEFKDRYEDGFPIEVIDNSKELCPKGVTRDKKKGCVNQKGSSTSNGSNIRRMGQLISNSKDDMKSTNRKGGEYKELSKNELLSKLPTQYISPGGKIVNVRDGVEGFLVGCNKNDFITGKSCTASGPAAQSLMSTYIGGNAQPQPCGDATCHSQSIDIVTIQIRLPLGQRCLLYMNPCDSIKDVREEFEKTVPNFLQEQFGIIRRDHKYEFFSIVSREMCDNHSMTLRDLKLTPNCTLMVKVDR